MSATPNPEPLDEAVVQELIARRQNLTVFRFLIALASHRGFILKLSLGFAVLAGIIAFVLKPRFEATTEILPPQQLRLSMSSIFTQAASSAAASPALSLLPLSSALQAKTQSDSFAVLLGSWPIEDELVKRFRLMQEYKARTPEQARHVFASHVKIATTKEGYITVTVSDGDPNRAAEIANAYIAQTRTFMKQLALTEASQRRLFYEREMGDTKEALARAETNFQAMQQRSHIISIDSQAKALIESAASLHSQITLREVELQRLLSYSTESNPQVDIAKTEIAALRGKLAVLESNKNGGFTDTGLSNVPSAELDYVRASRELKYQETLYELLLKQYEISRMDEASDAPLVQVVEPAFAPDHKAGPKRSLYIIVGFVLGGMIGLLIALYRFWRNQMTVEEAEDFVRLRRALFSRS